MEEKKEEKKLWQNKPGKLEYQHLFAIGAVTFVTVSAIILFYFSVARYSGLKAGWDTFMSILQPFIIGFCMAFLMNPIMKFFEGHMLHYFLPKTKEGNEAKTQKTVRVICSILSLLVLVGIIVAFFMVVIPSLTDTIQYLVRNLDRQLYGVLEWADEITRGNYHKEIRGAEKNMDVDTWIENAWDYIRSYLKIEEDEQLVTKVTTSVISIGRLLANSIIGIIVSVYMLIDKERAKGQVKKIIYAIFKPAFANEILVITRKAHDVFYGFIIGKIIDSAIIGVICYICMWIFGFPYRMLCSVIIGVTNIIPVFGPYIGAIPTVIIIFLTNPMKGIYFLIFVVILQQIDGNIIGPKILGDSTGLSSFWVVVAIVVGAGLGGVMGMIIGVPIMAMIYWLIDRGIQRLAVKKKLSANTLDYRRLKEVDEKTLEMREFTEEEKPHESIFHEKHPSRKPKKNHE